MKEKFYIVFAGVNGAGKSTLYHSGLWRRAEFPEEMERVNSDEILRQTGGEWGNTADQLRAMKEAVRRIEENFILGISFNQETTLAGRKCIQDIKRALDLGFKVVMFYIGVNHPDIANNRIAHRVSVGGHSIEPEVVGRRYKASLGNLQIAIEICNEVYLFDNSYELTFMRAYRQGQLELDRANSRVAWIQGLWQ